MPNLPSQIASTPQTPIPTQGRISCVLTKLCTPTPSLIYFSSGHISSFQASTLTTKTSTVKRITSTSPDSSPFSFTAELSWTPSSTSPTPTPTTSTPPPPPLPSFITLPLPLPLPLSTSTFSPSALPTPSPVPSPSADSNSTSHKAISIALASILIFLILLFLSIYLTWRGYRPFHLLSFRRHKQNQPQPLITTTSEPEELEQRDDGETPSRCASDFGPREWCPPAEYPHLRPRSLHSLASVLRLGSGTVSRVQTQYLEKEPEGMGVWERDVKYHSDQSYSTQTHVENEEGGEKGDLSGNDKGKENGSDITEIEDTPSEQGTGDHEVVDG